MSAFYTKPSDLISGTTARATDINDRVDADETGFDNVELVTTRSVKLPVGTTADQLISESAANRASKTIGFDTSGDLVLYSPYNWKGDWTTTTAYVLHDTVKDSSTKNLYFCLVGHTAGTFATDLAASKWSLAINVADVETAKTAAETAETNAATSETNASASETAAATSETNAATSETNASASETAAQVAQVAAELALDNFDDVYLGAKSSDPTVDNDGDALTTGDLYFDTSTNDLKVYSGSSWLAISNYTHPTGDGNLHVPATSTTNNGKVLTAGSTAGSLSWGSLFVADITDITSSAAELNLLDGVTATTAELNYSDGVTSAIQTQLDAKVDDSQVLTNVPSGALFTDTNTDTKWDGGATGLTAATGRTSLGLGTAATSAATAFETADATILKDADIGSTVQAYDVDTSKLDVAETRTASINMADNVLQRPELKDYAETVNAIGSVGGGAQDIDLALGNVVTATVDTSTTTFSFVNMPATGKGGAFTLILTDGGSQNVNWPTSVDWAEATQPTLTTAGIDVLTFTTVDGGTIWYGVASGLAMA